MRRLLVVAVAAGVLVVSAVGTAWAAQVEVAEDGLQPPRVQVDVGETIVWTNGTSEAVVLSSEDPAWTSGPLGPDESFSLSFEQAGTYEYGSSDGTYRGEIVVVAAGETGADAEGEPPAIAGDPTLPATGASPALAGLAAVLVIAGTGLLRRFRRSA